MATESEYINLIALSKVPKFGPVLIKELVSHFGSVEDVIKAKASSLAQVPKIGSALSRQLELIDHSKAEQIFATCQKQGIQTIAYFDEQYPHSLRAIPDHPIVLYKKGSGTLTDSKYLAIVGTRKLTPYGQLQVQHIVEQIRTYGPTIVSGLAFGTDILAHKAAIQHGLPTIAVIAGGLDHIYPPKHRGTADKMLADGAILSEQPPGVKPEAFLFPARNRIIAGMSEAVVVIESAVKGGSMITANLAFGYDREVFAVPGRIGDQYSQGCNELIKDQKAHILLSVADMAQSLHWQTRNAVELQLKLYEELDADELKVVNLLSSTTGIHHDQLMSLSGYGHAKLAHLLLQLELKGAILSLPGKRYQKA